MAGTGEDLHCNINNIDTSSIGVLHRQNSLSIDSDHKYYCYIPYHHLFFAMFT